VAAGAVYEGDADVVLESDPTVGVLHVTPALVVSLVTVAVSDTVSLPSTVVDDAVAETLMGWGLPPLPLPGLVEPLPQPDRQRATVMVMVMADKLMGALVLRPEGRILDLDISRPFNAWGENWRNYTQSR
jgi:hypothetical protein